MKENEYECAICHGIFEKDWSDEEALEETKAVICDDCWKKGLPNYKENN